MATKIYLTEEDFTSYSSGAKKELKKVLEKIRGKRPFNLGEKISISLPVPFEKDDRKVTITFSSSAYIKFKGLVSNFATEVQWHGLVRRISENSFYVYDIIVPPQKVSAVTVDTDQAEYEAWLDGLSDEEFEGLRFHGHSHVNMGVAPSSTDRNYRNEIIASMGTPSDRIDLFYIFMIYNKRGECSTEVFDLKHNAFYSSYQGDVVLDVLCDETPLSEFIKSSEEIVCEKHHIIEEEDESWVDDKLKSWEDAYNESY